MRLLITTLALCAAAAAQTPAFEVASVKPALPPDKPNGMICLTPCTPGERTVVEGGRVEIQYTSLFQLVVTAYRLKPYQVSAPEWMRSTRFDIMAKMPAGASKDQMPEMLQTLLAERFKLAFHRENREQPVIALVVAKNGPKLREAAPGAGTPSPEKPGDKPLESNQGVGRVLADGSVTIAAGPLGPVHNHMLENGMQWEFDSLTMSGLTDLLIPHEDHPVVDQTGLKGSYHLLVDVVRPAMADGGGRKGDGGSDTGARTDAYGDGLRSAVERAGLKLEARRAPVDTLVVDRVEKTPTEN